MTLVDCHFHIWEREKLDWLNGPMKPRIFGPYEPIRRDYPIEEFMEDAKSVGIEKAVYVQPNWGPGREVEEVRWVEERAERTGWPHAIVAPTDLMDDDCFAVMKEEARISKRMRGCRQQLHWHENPQYRYAPVPDQMNDPVFRKNLKHVADMGWLFELQVFSGQAENAAKLVRDFPDIPFVLVHAGMLEGDTPDVVERWKTGLKRLAENDNLAVKFSGQGTFNQKVDRTFIGLVVDECLATFGSERCMFGSNFPVEKLWTDYASIFEAYQDALSAYSDDDRRNVFGATAERVYRI
ncbi:amidohydrolase family protein [Jiella avicenniae]|uniref:Amidohydrolase family protein n=1 Tax=Jiella avicenniae TaxID=2907202 RepID=A0A9X1T5X7_9HYPH|nr:amidohydrolase family protein [Jiella avicenniae]MCE7029667.1 amidohydrolase family protein [Jiella avicenniae]